MRKLLFVFLISIFLAGCESNKSIVTSIDERQANEIVVFLASKGIAAQKIQAATGETAGTTAIVTWDIYVDNEKMVEAMAILNQNGLPRIQGTNLLILFGKTGLMTSDKEETIKYQAGTEVELENTIRKIDGVLDADVKISFPSSTEGGLTGTEITKIKAAVYVKHQGVFDDPNQHLESKIKRFISGSIENLSFDDVAVISDRSRFTDIKFATGSEIIGPKALEQEYVKIWSITMTKSSAKKFRFIFFSMILLIFIFFGAAGYLIYRFYPQLKVKLKKQNK
ncbi:MAG: Nodulation protein NolT [Candidatus Anoxychlamydiales bacterium]|nr:Nodulation protein NolT [Candidatus Anoxychlamydiales bacterium]NGX36466.1 Nodulation protein NolT [Candidatus Anoxychlamydiales bacterium]